MISSHTVTKLAVALLKAQKAMGTATKDSTNPFFRSKYADLNSIREVATPALNENGITVLQPTVNQGEKNFVETILLHESGEWIAGITEIKNTDGKPQSEGSGISYARRYGLQSLLNIGAVDDDGEAAQGRVVEKTPEKKPAVKQPEVVSKFTKENVTEPGITKDLIASAFKVLEAQNKISAEAFKMNYLAGKGLSTIAPSELPVIYEKMKKDYPHLSNGKGA